MEGTRGAANGWVLTPRPRPRAALRLFCFPYAGSSSAVYRLWPEQVASGVETCLVELPGRGARLREAPYRHAVPLVEAVLRGLLPYLDRPFALFGHSMGALLSFELARSLRRERLRGPAMLFVSGHRAPQLPETHQPFHQLPDDEFLGALCSLKGTPDEVLNNTELMELLMPILRADFSVCETYSYLPAAPLNCPITAIGGLADPHLTREDVEGWKEQTRGNCEIHMLPGDHFLLQSHEAAILALVNTRLRSIVEACIPGM